MKERELFGVVRQRKNGRWYWQIDLGQNKDGTRNRPMRERATQEEAVAAGLKVLAELRETGQVPEAAPDAGSVEWWYTQFIESVRTRPDVSPNTYRNHEVQKRLRIVPELGHLQMNELTTAKVNEFLDTIKTNPTREAAYKTLSVGWKEAVQAGVVKDPDVIRRAVKSRKAPAGKVVPAATSREGVNEKMQVLLNSPMVMRREAIRADDQKRIFKSLGEDRLCARFVVGMLTGPRQSEALGFAWPWLERPTEPDGIGVLHVGTTRIRELWAHGCGDMSPCQRTNPPGKCRKRIYLDPIQVPKTPGSVRPIFLGPGVMEILLDWEGLQTLELSALEQPPSIPWMFTNRKGDPISHYADARAWQRILKKANVSRHYSLHDLRRTAASEAAADPKTDSATLMGMFGWVRQTTADLYVRSREDRVKEAFQRQSDRVDWLRGESPEETK